MGAGARARPSTSLCPLAARTEAAQLLPMLVLSAVPSIAKMVFSLTGSARSCAAFVALFSISAMGASAQDEKVGGRSEIFAGSDLERYLRYLQTLGLVGTYPWTIRDFGP